jgi:hypothetical protein
MTTYAQDDLLAAIAEAEAENRAARNIVAMDDWEYVAFVNALVAAVRTGSGSRLISQNRLRLNLMEDTIRGPRCSIEPHHYSAYFSRAMKQGLIRKAKRPDGRTLKDICTTSPTGNNGKDQVVYEWLGMAS